MGSRVKRPVYLNLFRIRLPVTGVVSILHRITGVMLVLLLPMLLYALQLSLAGPDTYAQLSGALSSSIGKIILLLVAWFLAQHFFSGLRHLLLDLDIGIDRTQARLGAWAVFAAAAVTVLLLGISS